MDGIIADEIGTVVIAHKDRLTRFGFDLIAHLCEVHHCELLVLNTVSLSPEQEMVVQDLMTIIHCFSSRLDGLRNYRKALKEALAHGHDDQVPKIRLNPTPEQKDYMRRAAGSRRFIFNWGLDQWQQHYAAYKAERETVPAEQWTCKLQSALDLKKQFNAIREAQFPWTYDVTKCVVEGAFDDLGKAFRNFFAKRAKCPRFNKKGRSRDSFYVANDKFTAGGDHWVQMPLLGDFIVRSVRPRASRSPNGRR